MSIKEFVEFIAKENDMNIKSLGVAIGRGESISFWRTVTNEKIQVQELKKVISATDEPFIIKYRGQEIEIK